MVLPESIRDSSLAQQPGSRCNGQVLERAIRNRARDLLNERHRRVGLELPTRIARAGLLLGRVRTDNSHQGDAAAIGARIEGALVCIGIYRDADGAHGLARVAIDRYCFSGAANRLAILVKDHALDCKVIHIRPHLVKLIGNLEVEMSRHGCRAGQ